MSTFVPFKAYRPLKEKAKAVACRPYDVLNGKEAKAESEGNPHSFYHVIKPEIDFPDSFDPYAPDIYRKGKENFDHMVESGVLAQDERACFYVYQLRMGEHTQTGLVGCCGIDDYFNNVIKKHELTRPAKEADRKNHVRASKLNYEPVFFSYPKVDAIDALVEQAKVGTPVCDFMSDDGIQHTVWPISDEATVAALEERFAREVPKVYVADGHHRTAAGAEVGREFREARGGNPGDGFRDNYFMAVLFPDDQVKILDYNRVVKDTNGLSTEEFLQLLSHSFFIEEKNTAYRAESMHTFGMYLDGKWYKLTAKNGTYNGDPIGRLDVTILSKYLLEPILDIVDLRTDERIDFVGGMRGMGELEKRVDSGEMKVAFSMYPVSMQQLIEIADNDLLMPPKVTWFEPKLRSGLFVHRLDERY